MGAGRRCASLAAAAPSNAESWPASSGLWPPALRLAHRVHGYTPAPRPACAPRPLVATGAWRPWEQDVTGDRRCRASISCVTHVNGYRLESLGYQVTLQSPSTDALP